MPRVQRDREIKRRRQRNEKVRQLRRRISAERDAKARTRLLARLKRISPNAPV